MSSLQDKKRMPRKSNVISTLKHFFYLFIIFNIFLEKFFTIIFLTVKNIRKNNKNLKIILSPN